MKNILCVFFAILTFSHLHSANISWSSPPTTLSGASVDASNHQVAISASGNVGAVWVESNVVKASTKPVSGSWTPAVTISASGASSPSLVSDSNGNLIAVWTASNGVTTAASKPFGGSWSSTTALSGTNASSPTLCVDAAGNVVAGWVRAGNIETSTKLFGMNWQTKVTISSNTAATPSIAIGGSGSNIRAALVWQGISGGNNVVFTSTKLISGAWSSGQIISETAHQAAQPKVAVDANGNVLAVWYAYDITGLSYTNVVLKSAERLSSAGSWGAISDLSKPGIRNPATLVARVAFDSIGNAIALWNTSFDDETFTIQSAVKPVNENWGDTLDLETSKYSYSADLSVTSFGDVLATYMFYNGASLLIQSIESDINDFMNNFWSVPVTISIGTGNAFPKIAASLSGNTIHAVVVWADNNGVNNTIVASTGSKTLVLPPSNLNVTQNVNNFGVFNAYYNTISWNASSDPNVVGYLIFRNGAFIGQVAADVLQFIDDNRALNGAVRYSVTAIDAQNTQSTTVSVNFP